MVSLQTFSYDEDNLPKERVNSLWNISTGTWQSVEYYGYTWDEDGYCLSQWGKSDYYNSGMKYDYKYNDRKLGIEQVVSQYADGEFVETEKGEYEYDQYDNICEEHIYVKVNGKWENAKWTKATWDAQGRQLSYETHNWTGAGWDYSEARAEYAYDANGNTTLFSFYRYDAEAGSYGNYYRVEQDFNEKSHITRQETKYWNKDTQGWDGVYDWGIGYCYNMKTLFTYDDQGRVSESNFYQSPAVGVYIHGGDDIYTYAPYGDGGTEMYRESWLYDEGGVDK